MLQINSLPVLKIRDSIEWGRLVFLVVIGLGFGGCTTLRNHGDRVKIVSLPAGAAIGVNGSEIGQTPTFIELRRNKNMQIQLSKEGYGTKQVALPTTYRWRDSFFSNLIWFGWAPVAWGVDLLTGTAWDAGKPKLQKLDLVDKTKTTKKPLAASDSVLIPNRVIAIAPPQIDQELLSDEVGDWLEKTAQTRYRDAKIIPFQETETTFNQFQYFYDEQAPVDIRDDLYYKLKATHVLETQVQSNNDENIVLNAKLTNVFTDRVDEEFEVSVDSEGIDFKRRDPWLRKALSLVSIVPNTITFDTAMARAQIFADGPPGKSELSRYYTTSNKTADIMSYISGVGFKNFKSDSATRKMKFTFRFTPTVSLYYDNFRFESRVSPNEIQGVGYKWYNLLVGVGPEIGLESAVGYIYLNVIPALGYNWILWSQGSSDKSSVKLNVNVETEAGWSFFITDRFNIRFFTRALSANAQQWQDVMKDSLGREVEIVTQSQVVGGVAIGYYFPEARGRVKRLFR